MIPWLAIAALSLSAVLGSESGSPAYVLAGRLSSLDPALVAWLKARLVWVPPHAVPHGVVIVSEVFRSFLPSGAMVFTGTGDGDVYAPAACDCDREVALAREGNRRHAEVEAAARATFSTKGSRRFAEKLAEKIGEGIVLDSDGYEGLAEHVWLYVPSLGLHVDAASPQGVPRWTLLESFRDADGVVLVERDGVSWVGALDPDADGEDGLLSARVRTSVETLDEAALSERLHARCGWTWAGEGSAIWIEDLEVPFGVDTGFLQQLYTLALEVGALAREADRSVGVGSSAWAVASDGAAVEALKALGFEEAGRVPCRVWVKRFLVG